MVREYIQNSIKTKQDLLADNCTVELIEKLALLMVDTYKAGGKILAAGNGGSAADAQHMAGEIVSRFFYDRPALPAIALTTDTSILTAIGNDYGYDDVFARQIYANAVKGDIFIGISTSGNSINILKAIDACREKGVVTVGLTGGKVCKMDEVCDYMIKVPGTVTPHVQESHIMIIHILCAMLESGMFPKA